MTLTASILDKLNDQIADEFYAAQLYLSMSTWFDAQNLVGFAHWMRLQSDEERLHGLRLFDFVNSRRAQVSLRAIDEPPHSFTSPLDALEQAFAHEQSVSAKINDLYELAVSERDFATQFELQWFVTEQVEEEQSSELLVERVRLAGDTGAGLLLLDSQLSQRTLEG